MHANQVRLSIVMVCAIGALLMRNLKMVNAIVNLDIIEIINIVKFLALLTQY